MAKKNIQISKPQGKLGVMTCGMGAVATTFFAGVEAVRRNLALPIGSLTQMGAIRLGKRTDRRVPLIKDFVPLAELQDLVFSGWDIFPDDATDLTIKTLGKYGVTAINAFDALNDTRNMESSSL